MEEREVLEKISGVVEKAHVNVVFGAPQTSGEVTIIPYATVACGFGLGAGTTATDEACADEAGAKAPSGKGMGGGAGLKVRPLGYIEVGPMGTTIRPIVDEDRLALAGILLGAWAIAWLGLVLKAVLGRR